MVSVVIVGIVCLGAGVIFGALLMGRTDPSTSAEAVARANEKLAAANLRIEAQRRLIHDLSTANVELQPLAEIGRKRNEQRLREYENRKAKRAAAKA